MSVTFLDQVILVDDQDQELGVMDKVEAHRGQAKLHRAISVFLFNDQGELLLQQRSAHKIVGAGQWANTCCGNVRPRESYEQCARRRLREELGITNVALKPVEKFQYAVACNDEFSEREMDQIFVGKYLGLVRPNPAEVSQVVYKKIGEVQLDIKQNSHLYAPWLAMMIQKQSISQLEKK